MALERPTRGAIEAEVAQALVRFHREQQGRGPTDVRAHLLGDLLVVRYTGILTTTETHLSATEEGRRLIKSARQELRAISREDAEKTVAAVVGSEVLRSYYDVDVDAAEQIEVFVLGEDVDKRLLRNDLDRLSGLARKRV